ncbi:cysteine hydrolase [Jeongeupia wiesaeckerbachi]|uniref:cysteine hydrolase family protein n=1 Tax=Jeongeupia wiesaeckerbachi TaxID=3051218 RepID=UPI003D8004C4
MPQKQDRKALLVLDFINEIVHPDGQYASHGYADQARRRGVLENTAVALERARAAGIPVIFVVVGFSSSYAEWPAGSPVFKEARDGGRIVLGSWSTQVHDALAPLPHEAIVAKHRISPFYQTKLELLLRQYNVDTLLLAGVSTEFVILSTALEAHDRDYQVVVLEDATTSSQDDYHDAAIKLAARVATISTVAQALPARDRVPA